MQDPYSEHELPLLAGIGSVIRWFEYLVTLLAGPVLTVGAGIAVVDLLSDGALLTTQPFLLYIYAISQAVGIETQLLSALDRAHIAVRERRWWSLTGLLLEGGVLGYVTWVAGQVFQTQISDHISTAQALSTLGMSHTAWIVQRTAVAVGLVMLSGWNRYHAPRKVKVSEEEELAAIRRQAKVAEAKAHLNEVRARGGARVALGLINQMRGQQPTEMEETAQGDEPTGEEDALSDDENDNESSSEVPDRAKPEMGPRPQAKRITGPTRKLSGKRVPKARTPRTAEEREEYARQYRETYPDVSAAELARRLHCREGEASRILGKLRRQAREASIG